MSGILRDLVMILGGIIGIYLFSIIKNKVFSKTKEETIKLIPEEDRIKIKDLYEKGIIDINKAKKYLPELTSKEDWNGKKFVNGIVNMSPAKWGETIYFWFNARNLIIYGSIAGALIGFGWYKGIKNKPIHVAPIDFASEFSIIAPKPYDFLILHKTKNSDKVDWNNTNTGIVTSVKVKDIPGLYKKLKPYAFQFKYLGVLGVGSGFSGSGFEGGMGASWFRYYNWRTDFIITNRGMYPLGISYKVTPNSAFGLSYGYGYKVDQRVLLKYTWEF